MNHHFLNNLLEIALYTACIIWVGLFIWLSIGLYKHNWILVKRILKYFLNTVVFVIAWMFYLELALIVKPAIYLTKEDSVRALKSWITEYQIKDFFVALITMLILFSINLLFHYKLEKKKFPKDLFILSGFHTLVLAFGVWSAGQAAYAGLLQEINRYFG